MRVGPTLEQLEKDYPTDLQIVYMQHPLAMHKQAEIAAEAALAANAQGKFKAMHEKLMANSRTLSREKIIAMAGEIGLDVARFTKELDEHAHLPQVKSETAAAVSVGASGTPASFINGRYLRGAAPVATFKKVIDEELNWAKAGNRPEFKVGKNIRETQPPRQPRGPDPSKVYDLPVGGAPVIGAAKPKVRILHYLDYQ